MKDQAVITLAALGLLALIMCWALYLGYDGTLLAGVIGIFGCVVGYKAKAARVPVST